MTCDSGRPGLRYGLKSTDRRCVSVTISSALGNGQRDVVVLFMSAEPTDFIDNGRYDALRGKMPFRPLSRCVNHLNTPLRAPPGRPSTIPRLRWSPGRVHLVNGAFSLEQTVVPIRKELKALVAEPV